MPSRKIPCGGNPVRLDLRDAAPGQPGHLAGMRRKDQRPRRSLQELRRTSQRRSVHRHPAPPDNARLSPSDARTPPLPAAATILAQWPERPGTLPVPGNARASAQARHSGRSDSPSGSVISSGANPATVGRTDAGVATVASPAPMRNAAVPHMAAAPLLPSEPATTRTCPKRPLLLSNARGANSCGNLMRSYRIEILCGDDRRFRSSNGGDDDRSARQLREHVSRLGRGEGNDGTGAAHHGVEDRQRWR